jgi:serine/threonine protein kinase
MATRWKVGDRILNRWEIHKILRGGMGVVYIVYDHDERAALAAKTFHDEAFASNPAVADRFTQEAVTWINLDHHPNITRACFAQVVQDKPFLFLEYVSGGDLAKWVGSPRLTEDLPQVLRFGMDFCDGMSFAASKGIKVHRDVKPQNCLITWDGILKVTDFGLAKVYDEAVQESRDSAPASSVTLSQTGLGVGTALCMAPEQFDDAKHVDIRADVYSFGVMLFEMVYGQPPFYAPTWDEVRWLHKSQAPPRLKTRGQLNHILERCLAKRADLRFADFGEVGAALAAAYSEITGQDAKKRMGLRMINHLTAEIRREYARAQPGISLSSSTHLGIAEWLAKGASLAALGRHEDAIAWYDRVLSEDAVDSVAWSNKGASLGSLGRKREAFACYEEAIEYDPGDVVA